MNRSTDSSNTSSERRPVDCHRGFGRGPKAGVIALLLSCVAALPVGRTATPRAAPTPPPPWRAAVAQIDITPGSMMWLAGYASRNKPADGTTLPLHAKALVLEDAAGKRIALVTLDLVGIPRGLRLAVAAEVALRHGIPPAFLVMNASHTHSGPEVRADRTEPTDDPPRRSAEAVAYTRQLAGRLTGLVGDCVGRLQPARVRYSYARCGFAMNRRTPSSTGYKNHPFPPGPVDHQVPVLQLVDSGGRELAVVFGYACHNTTLALQQFNGDYAGYAQQALERAHPQAVALFVSGCGGDQNPYPRRELELAQGHGQSLATAVEAALLTEMQELSGPLRAAYEEIPLAYSRVPTRAELEHRQKSADLLESRYARRLLGVLEERRELPAHYPYPIQVLRLGDRLTLVALGGEPVVDYSLRLKRELRDPALWIAGYANDVMTYIPSLRVLREGGYEAGDAMKWGTHPAPWSADVEEHIVGTVHRLRRGLD